MATLDNTLSTTHTWVLNRVEKLTSEECEEDAYSIVQEFREWLDPDINDHDIYSLEYINGELEELDER